MNTKNEMTTQAQSGDPAQLPATPQPRKTLYEMLNSPGTLAEIEKTARGYMTGKYLVATLFQCASKTPDLLQCTPQSLVSALKTLAAMQCEPDGVHGYLVPFKTKNGIACTPIPSARGLMRMARRNGVRNLNIGVVREGDRFAWSIREGYFSFSHEELGWDSSRKILGVYCAWEDRDGQLHGVRMGEGDIEIIRKRSRAGHNGPWVTDWEQMAIKTVIKRAAKQWDLPHEAHVALKNADDSEFGGTPEKRQSRIVSAINPFSDVPMPEALPSSTQDTDGEPRPNSPADLGFTPPDTDEEPDMEACDKEFWGNGDDLPGLDVPPADYQPNNREDY